MKINIYSFQDNPSLIRGFTIVVDVFRAFTVSYFIQANKPLRYILTNSIEHALELKSNYAKPILIGERNGVQVPGFDYGNSPTAIQNKDFSGCTVIHTTTAGTKGVMDQPEKNEVVVGSFVNKNALLKHIKENEIEIINLYCTAPPDWGNEDLLFAAHFKKLLKGEKSDFHGIVSELKIGSGLRLLKSKTEPASDFEYCMLRNKFNTILKRKKIPGNDNAVELVKL